VSSVESSFARNPNVREIRDSTLLRLLLERKHSAKEQPGKRVTNKELGTRQVSLDVPVK
jgi:hypothetical protein